MRKSRVKKIAMQNLFFSYCWSEDTYYVSFGDIIENYTYQERREKRISYYQWMPFFLIFQAACFKLPTLIWKYFASQSGNF